MYGMANPSDLIAWFCEVAGGVMLQMSIATWLAVVNGMDFATAIAWGGIPGLVQGIRQLLNDETKKLGFGQAAQYMPTVINSVITAALFGKLPFLSTENALKFWSVWGLANGLFGYFATEPFMKGWEAPLNGPKETAMAKFFCGILACSGVQMAAVALGGKSVMESVALSYLGFAATQIDSLFITKGQETMGVDRNPAFVWLAIQLFTAASILIE